ncbi:hypothetical protein EW146_g5544 [Bondarzewia mesenterica]|uniref:Fe2OG dioxygenase domain-containing protein n=1 Tax=Bondarzewia mesenterica TaxID=1095465 RepID=A0A4S4LRT4_9AGAM|nr:hypothetical protein EW146_g5544 [Bondarzewia mesenterica]
MAHPPIKRGSHSRIAIIDFAPFLDGTMKQSVADIMLSSFKDVGFVYLVNHGLPKYKVQAMFDLSKQFFDLPMETKNLAPHPPSGSHHRGYSAPGIEKVAQHLYDKDEIAAHRAKAPDVKESFEVGREGDPIQPNIWLPDDVLPGFKQACLDFFWVSILNHLKFKRHDLRLTLPRLVPLSQICDEIKFKILSALALGLQLPEDFFNQFHQAPDNQLRLLHYPSVSASSLATDTVTRIGAHSDFGSITLLFQDNIGGLEVEDPNDPGQFQAAPPVKDALIVNAGDLLMRWSNDIIRSTVHRVRAPPGLVAPNGMTPERYSIPYDFDKVVECLPGTYDEHRPQRYEPISAMEYIMKRLESNY